VKRIRRKIWLPDVYLRTSLDCGGGGVAAAGEIETMAHTFQPSGRFSASQFLVAPDFQVSLHRPKREDVSDLRPNTEHARFEIAGDRAWPLSAVSCW
jgi:hypothetical protein